MSYIIRDITFGRDEIKWAAEVIATETGSAIREVAESLNKLIEQFGLLQNDGDKVTLKYAIPKERLREQLHESVERLKEMCLRAAERIDLTDYVLMVTPYQKPPYIERLHPRKDTHKTPYWHRIRSNPFRRNHH